MLGGDTAGETCGGEAVRSALRAALPLAGAIVAALVVLPDGLRAQVSPDSVLRIGQGNSEVLRFPTNLERVSVGDPQVADAVVVSAREVVINGLQLGTTTVLTWGDQGQRRAYRVRVTPDVAALEEDLAAYFPDQEIRVSSSGPTIVLSGTVTDPQAAQKAVTLAEQAGGENVSVMDNMEVPDPPQVLLQVRFAEVNRSAMKELGSNLLRVDPDDPFGDDAIGATPGSFSGGFPGEGPSQSFSDAVNFFLFDQSSSVGAFIQALRSKGFFRSLAEPNLLAVPGDSASFLAGGEFPFPMVQGGQQSGAVTVEFREFGVRLNFHPTITNSGAIRLRVAPEVSQLDFSNALEIQNFQVPALSSRRAETTIELEEGQTFAIAGLLDSSMTENVSKVPFLGDIPILGALFRSKTLRQERTELLVLVTPQLVQPREEAPALPTGEPETWEWLQSIPDSLPVPSHTSGQ